MKLLELIDVMIELINYSQSVEEVIVLLSPSSSAFGPASGAALPACSTAASERKRMMSRS